MTDQLRETLLPDGMRVLIRAAEVEFNTGSDTLWVHSPTGGTILRIKLPPGVRFAAHPNCENVCSHSDITVEAVQQPLEGHVLVCLNRHDAEVQGEAAVS